MKVKLIRISKGFGVMVCFGENRIPMRNRVLYKSDDCGETIILHLIYEVVAR